MQRKCNSPNSSEKTDTRYAQAKRIRAARQTPTHFSSWHQFTGTQPRPLSCVLLKALATHHIPFHLDIIFARSNVDVNAGLDGLENRILRHVRHLMLRFYCVVGNAAIYVMAVNTNTHDEKPLSILTGLVEPTL